MNDTPSTPWLQTPQIMAFPTNEAIRSQSTLYKVPGAQLLSVREVIVSNVNMDIDLDSPCHF